MDLDATKKKAISMLAEEMDSRRLAIFLGAGSSMVAGFPSSPVSWTAMGTALRRWRRGRGLGVASTGFSTNGAGTLFKASFRSSLIT